MHISQINAHIRLVRTINWEVFLFNRFIFSLLSIFEYRPTANIVKRHWNILEHFALQHLINNASLTQSLTDGVTGVHVSFFICVLRANDFNTMFYDCKLICVDTGKRI